jgi:hypothetical protein
MKEVLYHSLGLCGESHPSMLSLLAIGITPFIIMYKKIINYVKKVFIH